MVERALTFNTQKDSIKKIAYYYWLSCNSPETKPSMMKAMLKAGYAKSSATKLSHYYKKHPVFIAEMERLELTKIDYSDLLETIRHKALMELKRRGFKEVKPKETAEISKIMNEQLRLQQGESTQNIGIAGIIKEIEDSEGKGSV